MQPQKITVESFSKESSIHGIKFIGDTRNPKSIRIFWTLAFLFSIAGFIYYANSVYVKWSSNPDITMKMKWKSIRDIPFPAVTICLPLFSKRGSLKFNSFTDIRNVTLSRTLSARDQSKIAAAAQGCNPSLSSRISKFLPKASSEDFIDQLQSTTLTVDEAFEACFFERRRVDCNQVVSRVIFDTGYCYTYNIQGYNTIFRKDNLTKDFDSYKGSNESLKQDWTIFNGYDTENDQVFPVRAAKNGVATFYLKINVSDVPDICSRYGKGFRMYLHSPNEIATFCHNEYFIPFNQEKQITLGAKYIHYNNDLRIYSPDKRQCYFENEKKLKFFKSYSKAHCLLECLTSYTLKTCGCVKFSMPRTQNTPICNLTKVSCYMKALKEWPYPDPQGAKTLMPCDCFQTCNDIAYSIKLDRTGEFESKVQNISDDAFYSEIGIKFNDILIEENDFFVGYKLQNFIADTGGLLGLFMGCSILSIVELIYYFCKGFYKRLHKYKAKTNPVAENGQAFVIKKLHGRFQRNVDHLDYLGKFSQHDRHIYIIKRPIYNQ